MGNSDRDRRRIDTIQLAIIGFKGKAISAGYVRGAGVGQSICDGVR